uniref:NADH-ubiquinone oxidoreductase chain 4L n=1 Tax=Orius niger TaxID=82746 RepID=B7SMI8_ORINI|nr:NADH dehydrogenase subunit 4L [Orius niger]ABZ02082.1 NADH dehydrogenase subunit 4L [Orius niger]
MLYNYLFILFFLGLISFCSVRKHLLLSLLTLEYLVLVLFISLYYYLIFYYSCMYFMVVFLTFTVCEGSLGLSVLVSLIRCHGNDNLSILNFLKW